MEANNMSHDQTAPKRAVIQYSSSVNNVYSNTKYIKIQCIHHKCNNFHAPNPGFRSSLFSGEGVFFFLKVAWCIAIFYLISKYGLISPH